VLKNGRRENDEIKTRATDTTAAGICAINAYVRSASGKGKSVSRMLLDAWESVPKRTNREHLPENWMGNVRNSRGNDHIYGGSKSCFEKK